MKGFDFIIVGSGISGLSAAALASGKGSVLLVTKEVDLRSGSSFFDKNGLAASQNADLHIKDTMEASHHTSDKDSLEFFVSHSWYSFLWLKNKMLVPFSGEPKIAPGHCEARIWTSSDNTGEVIVNRLIDFVENEKSIEVLKEFKVDDILTDTISMRHSRGEKLGSNKVIGIFGIKDGTRISFFGKNVLLATGGVGQKYGKTTNSFSSTGDGIELAKSVGAKIKNMDLIQWYPFCFRVNKNPVPYFDSTIIGDGAFVVNRKGERFLRNYHKDGEMAPLDNISNAFFSEEKLGNGIYLDLRHKQKIFWKNRFPHSIALLGEYGFDIQHDIIPITSAVHYLCGGIEVDVHGRTSVPGLYAIGEVSDTGIHGVSSLVGNSITESLVWARSFVESAEL